MILDIIKHYEKGFGQGELVGYKPWIKVNQMSSQGRSHRPLGLKTGRVHHLLSDLELKLFNIYDFSDDILDIREQYPLLDPGKGASFDQTKKIASHLGIKYPQYKSQDIVMTTDFVLTLVKDRKLVARTVKYTNDLTQRTIEKFEIEKTYWKSLGVDWAVVTEKELSNNTISNNLNDLRESFNIISRQKLPKALLFSIFEFIKSTHFTSENKSLSQYSSELDIALKLEQGFGLRYIKYFMAIKAIRFDVNISLQQPLVIKDIKLEFRKNEIYSKSNLAA